MKPNAKEAIYKVEGAYKCQFLDDNGNKVYESEWVKNQIVNTYAFVMTQLFLGKDKIESLAPYMAIGVDRTPVTHEHTKLFDEKFRVLTEVTPTKYVEGEGLFQNPEGTMINAVDITGVFEKGIVCDIGEIGLFWGIGASEEANTGIMISRKDIPNGWDKQAEVRAIFIYRLIFREV